MDLWIRDQEYESVDDVRARIESLTPPQDPLEEEELAHCWAIFLGYAMHKHCSSIARQGNGELYSGALSTIASAAYSVFPHGSSPSVKDRQRDLRSQHLISNKLRKQIYERDAYRCQHCDGWTNLSIDHIIPITKGGQTTRDNLQTLCMPCNIKKGNNMEGNTIGSH